MLKTRQGHGRLQDAALALSKAFALAAASDEAKAIRDEVAFFQTSRAAMVKSSSGGRSKREREFAVQQLIDRSVVSTEIFDIQAAGLESPDISILSDEFLTERKDSDRSNLALEALKKLLADKIAHAPAPTRSRAGSTLNGWPRRSLATTPTRSAPSRFCRN